MALSAKLRVQLMDIAVRYGGDGWKSTYRRLCHTIADNPLPEEHLIIEMLGLAVCIATDRSRRLSGVETICGICDAYSEIAAELFRPVLEGATIFVDPSVKGSSSILKKSGSSGLWIIIPQHFGDLHDHGCPLRFLLDVFEVVHSSSPSDGKSAADSSSDPRTETVPPKAESCPHCGPE